MSKRKFCLKTNRTNQTNTIGIKTFFLYFCNFLVCVESLIYDFDNRVIRARMHLIELFKKRCLGSFFSFGFRIDFVVLSTVLLFYWIVWHKFWNSFFLLIGFVDNFSCLNHFLLQFFCKYRMNLVNFLHIEENKARKDRIKLKWSAAFPKFN